MSTEPVIDYYIPSPDSSGKFRLVTEQLFTQREVSSARDAVWEKAIAALPAAWIPFPHESPQSHAKRQGYNQALANVRTALEAARDEALSAGKSLPASEQEEQTEEVRSK